MFGHKYRIFRLLGFSVNVDASWLLLVMLVTWSLAEGVFPIQFPGHVPATYWWMGFVGAMGLFACIVLHELGHAIVARHFGIPIKEITLFIFGGVAEMEDEPPSARSEFLMAIAGPATSVALALAFSAIYRLAPASAALSNPAVGVVGYLAWLNGLLALFNLLPAFPLDGGRVLRAALWAWRENLPWSTRVASQIGSFFGVALIVLGVLAFLSGQLIAGIWWVMIGLFMRSASRMSYKQVLVRQALEGESLRRFMRAEPVTVSPDLSIREIVEDYVYRFHYKMFPVVENGTLLGYVSTREIKELARERWEQTPVRQIVQKCSETNSISPDTDPMKVLSMMNRTGASRLMVVEGQQLVGIVTLKDLLKFLSLKMDLEARDEKEHNGNVVAPPVWNLRHPDFKSHVFGEKPSSWKDQEKQEEPHELPKAHV